MKDTLQIDLWFSYKKGCHLHKKHKLELNYYTMSGSLCHIQSWSQLTLDEFPFEVGAISVFAHIQAVQQVQVAAFE